MSLPNLSWDNIDNCLLSQYTTRKREHIIKKRGISFELENAKCEEWASTDFSTEAQCSNAIMKQETNKC